MSAVPILIGPSNRGFLPEIQALRAVAVALVIGFHLSPDVLAGGYVGVDVFFVISGYLITGIIIRGLEGPRPFSLAEFYGKRVRRLLPAASLVLFAVIVAVPLLPQTQREETLFQVVASALYFENWWLAAKSVDYLAEDGAPTALQHYWSLSIEEQYYLLWPLVLLGASRSLGSRVTGSRGAILLVCVAVALTSFLHSIHYTSVEPARAYFATSTRAWEFAVGGAAAAWRGFHVVAARIRPYFAATGLALIAGAAFTYDGATPFPGYTAMVPVVGALLVMAGCGTHQFAVGSTLGARPIQWLGNVSYSAYLWHWPLIVFYGSLSSGDITFVSGAAILVVTLGLAGVTKTQVEDRFRTKGSESSWFPFRTVVACLSLTAVLASSVLVGAQWWNGRAVTSVAGDDGSSVIYPGASALLDGMEVPVVSDFVPSALNARLDRADAYGEGCIALYGQAAPLECRYGTQQSTFRVVLFGDSHAVQWLPALQEIASDLDWELIALTKVSCSYADVTVLSRGQPFEECRTWAESATKRILELSPNVVLATQSVRYDPVGLAPRSDEARIELSQAIKRRWNQFNVAGIPVVAIRDTPRLPINVPDCLTARRADMSACNTMRSIALASADPTAIAATESGIPLIDLTDGICGETECAAVVGNVLVWMDSNHITATYARSLAPALRIRLEEVLREELPR